MLAHPPTPTQDRTLAHVSDSNVALKSCGPEFVEWLAPLLPLHAIQQRGQDPTRSGGRIRSETLETDGSTWAAQVNR